MIVAPAQPVAGPLSESVTVSLTRQQKDELRATSVRTGKPMSTIVRERYLARTETIRGGRF